MKSHTTRRFRDLLAALPERVQKQPRQAYQLFQQNPAHPGLRFKQVLADPPIYSARVGVGYRAVGARDEDAIIWFWIGSHADYELLLKTLP